MKKRKVLILTAENMGTVTKASADAIEKQLKSRGYMTRQVDCFNLMGKFGRKMAAWHGPLTTRHPFLWQMIHGFSQVFTGLTHWFFYRLARVGLLVEIKAYQPDLIISVHGNFTKVVSKVLRKADLKIPLMINVTDLVNPSHVWRDKDAAMNFLPTAAVKLQYEWLGFDPKRIVVSGFPRREDIVVPTVPKVVPSPLKILMVTPALKVSNSVHFVREVAEIPNTQLTVICGHDERLYQQLTALQQSGALSGVMIYGYVNNLPEFLANSQILMTMSGPNLLLEGSRSGTAMVVTGHTPGQRAENYRYVTENGFGFRCENPALIKEQLTEFINSHELEQCLARTLFADGNDGAQIIADQIDQYFATPETTKKVAK